MKTVEYKILIMILLNKGGDHRYHRPYIDHDNKKVNVLLGIPEEMHININNVVLR